MLDTPVSIATLKARANALKRHRGVDNPDTIAAATQLRAAVLERHIREVVDAAPPLTDEQRTKLAGLLAGGAHAA